MDVKTTFLHDDLEKEIYMEQSKSFVVKGKENYVCKLKKSLYELNQVPRQWYKKFDSILMGEHGFHKTTLDHCVFVQKFASDDFIILLLYSDDILMGCVIWTHKMGRIRRVTNFFFSVTNF